jgi:hypothetical protein
MTSSQARAFIEHRNAVARRFAIRSLQAAARAASPAATLLPARPPRRPVFLIGCPRSGTSLLFEALRSSPNLASLPGEGHLLWDTFHHPRKHDWRSNALSEDDLDERERGCIYSIVRAVARSRRFLDKTPKNCLRIPYLTALFEDATFVFLRRRAADNINSLIQGWRAYPRYVTYRLPIPLQDAPGSTRAWSFALVDGWQALQQSPLEEICAHQYLVCNEALLAGRDTLPPESVVDVFYEDFVDHPREEFERILARLSIDYDDRLGETVERLSARPINALTAPAPEKWRRENETLVERVLPIVADVERRLGYDAASLVG